MVVFDYAAFRKDDDFSAAQYLPRQHREQARMIVRKDADMFQIVRENIVLLEEFAGSDRATVSTGFFKNQKLRNECFEA